MFEIQTLNRKEVVQSSFDNANLIFDRVVQSASYPNEITSEGEYIIRRMITLDGREMSESIEFNKNQRVWWKTKYAGVKRGTFLESYNEDGTLSIVMCGNYIAVVNTGALHVVATGKNR